MPLLQGGRIEVIAMQEVEKVLGHEEVIRHLQNAVAMDQVSHSFIYSRAGKGSYISSPQHNVFSMSFSEDDSGNQTKYRNITVIEPSEEIRNALELNSSDKVIEISRVISRNGIRR